MERSIRTLTEITGVRPVGFRAPSWNFSEHMLDYLLEFGFVYDSSLMADDRPYEVMAKGKPTGLVELPVSWIPDDASFLVPRGSRAISPRGFLTTLIDDFDKAYEEETMFLVTMHPSVIGRRSAIGVLEDLIDHIKQIPAYGLPPINKPRNTLGNKRDWGGNAQPMEFSRRIIYITLHGTPFLMTI